MAITSWTAPDTGYISFDPNKIEPQKVVKERRIAKEESEEQKRISELESRPLSSFLLSAVDSALLSPKVVDFVTGGQLKDLRSDLLKSNPTASLIGSIGGMLVPGTASVKGANVALKGVSKIGTKIAPKLTSKAVGAVSKSKIATEAIRETVAGGLFGLGTGIAEQEDISQIAKRTGLDALLGGTIGAGVGVIGKRIAKAKAAKKLAPVQDIINDINIKPTRVEDTSVINKLKRIREAKATTKRPTLKILDDIKTTRKSFDEQINKIDTDFESRIAKVKETVTDKKARKTQLRKLNNQKEREIAKVETQKKKAVSDFQQELPQPTIEPRRTTADIETPKADIGVPRADIEGKKPIPTRVDKTPEQIDIDRQVADVKARYATDRKVIEKGFMNAEDKGKRLKAMVMKESAEIRQIKQGDKLIPVEGGLTNRELNNKIKKLKSNYIGKEVVVDGRVGKINKNVFGDVMVKFDDGTISKIPKDEIVPKTDIDQLISKQRQEVLKSTPKTEVKAKRTLPKKIKVKGTFEQPKATENTSASSIANQLADEKPKYKSKEKLSRARAVTIRNADITPENMKKTIDSNKVTYKSVDNQKDWDFSKSKVDKNFEAEYRKFKDTPNERGSLATTRGEALYVKALQNGNFKLADEISSELSLRLTQAGQEIQALAFFKKLSPEGMVMYQQKIVNKVNASLEELADKQFKKIKPKKNVATGVFKFEDLVDDIGWLKGYLEEGKICKL